MPVLSKVETQDLLAELTSGDDARAENSISAILDLGMAAIPTLLELTRAPEADSRWWAVRALAASPHTQTVNLLPLLSDSAAEVRAAAALALCSHPHESAVEALVKALADDDSLTAGLAGNALEEIGSPSVPSLLTVMSAAPTGIRIKIVTLRTLCNIRDHRAIPAMMKALNEESVVLQYWAQRGLERLGLDMIYMKP